MTGTLHNLFIDVVSVSQGFYLIECVPLVCNACVRDATVPVNRQMFINFDYTEAMLLIHVLLVSVTMLSFCDNASLVFNFCGNVVSSLVGPLPRFCDHF